MNVIVNEKMKEMKVLVKKNRGIVSMIMGVLFALILIVIILSIRSVNHQKLLKQSALTSAVVELGKDMNTQMDDMSSKLGDMDDKVQNNIDTLLELMGISKEYVDNSKQSILQIENLRNLMEEEQLRQMGMDEDLFAELVSLTNQFEGMHTMILETLDFITLLKEQNDSESQYVTEQMEELYEKMFFSVDSFQKEYLSASEKLDGLLATLSEKTELEHKLLLDNDAQLLENNSQLSKEQEKIRTEQENLLAQQENLYKTLLSIQQNMGMDGSEQLEEYFTGQTNLMRELLNSQKEMWASELTNQTTALSGHIDDQISSVKEQTTGLSGQIDSQISSIKDQNTALSNQVENQMGSIKDQNTALSNQVEKQMGSIKDQNTALSNQIDNQISSVKDQNTQLNGQINEKLTGMIEQNNSFQTVLNNLQDNLGNRMAEYTAIVDAQYENLANQYTAYVNNWGQKHEGLLTYLQNSMNQLDAKLTQVFQSVSNGKKLLASALLTKGVSVSEDASFQTIAEGILSIQQNILLENLPGTISYNYHYHVDGFGNQPHANQVSVEARGNCYLQPIYHVHSGDTSTYGGCYTVQRYHNHTGSAQTGGGCYGMAVIHHHTDDCYEKATCYAERYGYQTSWEGGIWYEYYTTNHHDCGLGIIKFCHSAPMTHEVSFYHEYIAGLKCGYEEGEIEYYELNCGKDASTPEGYILGCNQSEETIIGYAPSCGKVDGQILSATIVYSE